MKPLHASKGQKHHNSQRFSRHPKGNENNKEDINHKQNKKHDRERHDINTEMRERGT
jgi:hypothetical protein